MSGPGPEHINPALEQHGIVFDAATIARGEEDNLKTLRNNYCEEVRKAVIGSFSVLTYMLPGINWAIYDVPPKSAPGEEPIKYQEREILTMVDNRGQRPLPVIRIYSNESFLVNSHAQYLTEDITIDDDNDAHFFVSAIQPSTERFLYTFAPLFYYSAQKDRLVIDDYEKYTQPLPVTYAGELELIEQLIEAVGESPFDESFTDGDTMDVYPFGLWEDMLDQIGTLSIAAAILQEIVDIEPTHYGVQPSV